MRGGQSIYFIQAASGPVKIGIAADPVKRLMGLQSGHHEQLALVCVIEGGPELERTLHRRFALGLIRGEWFRADTPGLADLIASVLDDKLPSWLTGTTFEDVSPIRLCACGWPIEGELADRGAETCWTCQTEAAAK